VELAASRYVLEYCSIETIPVHPGSLAAPPQCVPPSATDFGSETIQSVQIRGHSMVAEVAFHHTMQPSADGGHRFVPSPEKRFPDRG
jgi:hypothetical protein